MPGPSRPAVPAGQVEVRSRSGVGRSSERMLTVSPWQLSVRWIIVSNNVDLGVILATQELLMVTTVIIQLRPWLSLLSTPSPRLSGWWQMPPHPPSLTWELPSKHSRSIPAAVLTTGSHFTLASGEVSLVHHHWSISVQCPPNWL